MYFYCTPVALSQRLPFGRAKLPARSPRDPAANRGLDTLFLAPANRELTSPLPHTSPADPAPRVRRRVVTVHYGKSMSRRATRVHGPRPPRPWPRLNTWTGP